MAQTTGTEFEAQRIQGRTYAAPLELTDGYRRGEVSLVQAAAGLAKWGWDPPRIARALTHPSGHGGRRAAYSTARDEVRVEVEVEESVRILEPGEEWIRP
ncbi:MAG TPA: hypothetical protein VMB72_01080 [Acidimicrobiales bacterium]|nr:hypothetical protein [Acidimicrobiales bacterium]